MSRSSVIRFALSFATVGCIALAIGLVGCHGVPALDIASQSVDSCTNDICVENDRSNGVRELPPRPAPATEATGYAWPGSIDRMGPNNQLQLRIESTMRSYRIQILRVGYYGGSGARIVATLSDAGGAPYPIKDQPPCTRSLPEVGPYADAFACSHVGISSDSCSNWTGHTWTHPSDLPSGVYLAHVVDGANSATTLASIPFIVRDDRRTSSVLLHVPDTKWQAYNVWGDLCNLPGIGGVYVGPPSGFFGGLGTGGRIRTVRWDRPYTYRDDTGDSYDQRVYTDVVPYVQFFEKLGADVSYITAHDLDADWARPQAQSLLVPATAGAKRVVVLAAHDEYWSQERRNDIERARSAGVHLMFLTANDVHWRTKQVPDGILVAKDSTFYPGFKTQENWTGLWGDPRYLRSTTGDATGPENATGGLVSGAWSRAYHYEVLVSAEESAHRFWRDTAYANGGTAGIAPANLHVIEGEWDMDSDNGFRPPGLSYLSSSATVGNHITKGQELAVRSHFTSVVTHHMVMFRDAQSGAITFHAGTTDFANALEDEPCDGGDVHGLALQRGLINLMADMGLPAPGRLCPGWWTPPPVLPPPPSGTVTAPTLPPMMGRSLELRGTATAGSGATVAAVEVGIRRQGTTDIRYAPAAGRQSWVYDWTPPTPGTYEIRARVTDDRGQITDGGFTTFAVTANARLFDDSDTFAAFSTFGVERWIGTKFRVSVTGTVSELRIFMPDSLAYSVALVEMLSGAGPSTILKQGMTEAKAGWRGYVFPSSQTLSANRDYAAMMLVPENRLYPFVPPSAVSVTADAPPLRYFAGLASHNSQPGWHHQLPAFEPLAGIPVDVVFDASTYWSTATTPRGWFTSVSSVQRSSSVEKRIGFEWTPTSDGYVDGVRVMRYTAPADTNNYLVELHATPAQHLMQGPAIIAAAPIPQGTSVATFDKPARVFRGHTYRLVVQVEAIGTFPGAPSSPPLQVWLSSLTGTTAVCTRESTYNTCSGPSGPEYTYTTFGPTPTGTPHPAIDVLFRPTAAFRQSLWPRTGVTPMKTSTDPAGGTMGTAFQSPSHGYVDGIRFYNTISETATVRLYDCGSSETCACSVTATCPRRCETTGTPIPDASNWYTVRFERPCAISAGTYLASVYLASGNSAYMDGYFQKMQYPVVDMAPAARNLYEEGFLVARASGVAEGDEMPGDEMPVMPQTCTPCSEHNQCTPNLCNETEGVCTTEPPCRRAYFVEPIVRNGR
jgi:hypothetical protein